MNIVTSIQEEKRLLRQAALRQRDRQDHPRREAQSMIIQTSLQTINLFATAQTILLYASIRGEVATYNLLESCLNRHARTVLPRVDKKAAKLLLYQILSPADLVPGAFGIPEPDIRHCAPVRPDEIDYAIIPGVAFDETGARIGYGKGYYDTLLAGMHAPTAGLCFEHQLVGRIPCEPHDRRVTMIITEKRIIHCDGHEKN